MEEISGTGTPLLNLLEIYGTTLIAGTQSPYIPFERIPSSVFARRYSTHFL